MTQASRGHVSFFPSHLNASKATAQRAQQRPTGASASVLLLLVIVTAGVAIRLALLAYLPQLPSLLQRRFEINDPFTSWTSVSKTLWQLKPPKNVRTAHSPFKLAAAVKRLDDWGNEVEGTQIAVPTPLLAWISSFWMADCAGTISYAGFQWPLAALVFTALDALAAMLLYRIARLSLRSPVSVTHTTNRKIAMRLSARHLLQSLSVTSLRNASLPHIAAAVYIFNPLTLLTNLARSGAAITVTAVLISVWGAMEGATLPTALGSAIASSISLHPILLTPAILTLHTRQVRYKRHHQGRRVGRRKPDRRSDWLVPTMALALFLSISFILSAAYIEDATTGPHRVMTLLHQGLYLEALRDLPCYTALFKVYRSFLLLPSLSPSLSQWWYFFISIFDHFRSFFLVIFNVNLVLWTLPLTLRFQHDPLFATFLLLGIQTIFKPYPTSADFGLLLSLCPLFPSYTPHLRHPCITTLITLIASLLIPLFSHLFLTLGSANANFLYASTTLLGLATVVAWLDWAWAAGREAWEREREAGLGAFDELDDDDDDDDDRVKVEKEEEEEEEEKRGWKRIVVQM